MTQTATNPATGETVALIGGEWKSVTQTATNNKGNTAYLVGNEWIVDDGAISKQAEVPPESSGEYTILDLLRFSPGAAAVREIRKRVKGGYILTPEEEVAVRQALQGASSGPVMGAVQLAADVFGADDLSKNIANNRKEGSIVGTLMQPEAWLTGGAIPKIASVGKQAIALGGLGAGYASLSPNESMKDRLEEGGVAGVVSGAIPVVGRAVVKITPYISSLVDSIAAIFGKGGRVSVGQRMALNQLSPEERTVVLQKLNERGIDTSDLGSSLTTSEALAKSRISEQVKSPAGAGLASLEAELSSMPGGDVLRDKSAERGGLISSMLDTLSGGRGAQVDPLLGMSADDVALAKARSARSKTAGNLYPSGEVTGDARLNAIMDRPGVRSAMGIEDTSAANVPRVTQIGKDIPSATRYDSVFTDWQQTPYKEDLPAVFAKYPIKSLQNQYRLMDKEANRLMKTGVSTDETRAYELLKAKKDLGEWLASASPEWAQANRMFAMQSTPVRQMEVGTALKKKMDQSPSAFLKATGDAPSQEQLIRRETGRPNQSLTDIFNLGQMSKIAGLQNEAQITEEVKALQRMVKPQLKDEAAFQLPNLLNVWVAVANRVAKTSANATKEDVTRAAAEVLSNPNKMRTLLAEDARRQAMASLPMSKEALRRVAPPAFFGGRMMTGEEQ